MAKEICMNQEQFGRFWEQLKTPLKDYWPNITAEDLTEIRGDLATLGSIIQKRYGERQIQEVHTWVNRRYCHWSGNSMGYKDPEPTP